MQLKRFDYEKLISDLKAILAIEKIWGEKAINHIKMQVIWKLGERICQEFKSREDEKKHGLSLYMKISKHIGITKTTFFDSIKFFLCYPRPQYISPEITWNHYRLLIIIIDDRIRRFYEIQSISNTWSVRQLREKIKINEHENPLPPRVLVNL